MCPPESSRPGGAELAFIGRTDPRSERAPAQPPSRCLEDGTGWGIHSLSGSAHRDIKLDAGLPRAQDRQRPYRRPRSPGEGWAAHRLDTYSDAGRGICRKGMRSFVTRSAGRTRGVCLDEPVGNGRNARMPPARRGYACLSAARLGALGPSEKAMQRSGRCCSPCVFQPQLPGATARTGRGAQKVPWRRSRTSPGWRV